MGKYTIPAPGSPAEEWGRLAASIPGWRWMPGMRCRQRTDRGSLEPWEAAGVDGAHRRYMGGELRKHWSVFRPSPRRGTWHAVGSYGGGLWHWPDPDDPATAGCLLALLGAVAEAVWFSGDCSMWAVQHDGERLLYTSLGRACIAAAAALGEWPGGAE